MGTFWKPLLMAHSSGFLFLLIRIVWIVRKAGYLERISSHSRNCNTDRNVVHSTVGRLGLLKFQRHGVNYIPTPLTTVILTPEDRMSILNPGRSANNAN